MPQVAAALPGGDPLAAALAAGETPSPEMVAAAGEEGALAPGRAWALLGAAFVMVLIVLLLTPFSTDLGLAPLPKSPDALFDRAGEIARKLGYAPTAADTASWWDRQYDMLRYRADHIPSPKRVRELATFEPHPWWFWYRQSPRPMVATDQDQVVRRDDPPLEVAGMVSLALDARGNLVRFRAVPPQIDESKGSSPAPDWDALFHEAGLDPRRFVQSGPKWLPPTFSDARAEWDGSFERQPDLQIHVTAAAYRGKPVYFEVLGPWDRLLRMPEVRQAGRPVAARAAFIFLVLGVLTAGVIFARRNLLAVGVAGLVLTLLDISGEKILVEVPMALALATLTIFAVTRFGIVALAVSFLSRDLLLHFPLTRLLPLVCGTLPVGPADPRRPRRLWLPRLPRRQARLRRRRARGSVGSPYRIASIGERREARMAGYMPKVRARRSAVTQAISRPTGLTTNP